ncbi:MAG: membrane protein insertase YidC [Desulfobacteraceae bacterium]|nr:membrane protein insertase YidC [Desulfobacteraceae bacterium]
MEQLRLLLAVVLSFIVFFGWNYFYTKNQTPPENQAVLEQVVAGDTKIDAGENTDTIGKLNSDEKQNIIRSLPVDEKKYIVETDNYIVELSSIGAKIISFRLKNYKERNKDNSPLKEMVEYDFLSGSFFADLKSDSGIDLKKANFYSKESSGKVKFDSENYDLVFEYQTESGFKIRKKYSFYKKSYLFDCDITVINNTGNPFSNQLSVSINSEKPEAIQVGFVGPTVYRNNKLDQIKIKNLDEEGNFTSRIEWGGLESIYFITAVVPDFDESIICDFSVLKDKYSGSKKEFIKADFISTPFNLQNGEKKIFNYHFYVGPKSMDTLKAAGFNLEKSVDFGFFDSISKPCLWVLNYIYKVIPNYGVSIIILTLLVKIIFWPLGTKSAKSMEQMKKIQPLMKEIRDKYKNDKQKMNQEVMNLYKVYKVNPLSGCLPILVQIPIFFGLYRMLFSAIELRHAPFMFWIQDLSAPDRLFDLSFAIPFMKEPYGLPLLTIIMGASMFLQQKMTPTGGDPTQAKIMLFMPVFITIIFVNLPAGLVLYMLVNNIFSMGQQYYVSRSLSK